jgi:hypothetical protein
VVIHSPLYQKFRTSEKKKWKIKRHLKQNKVGYTKIKNIKRVENFKYLGVVSNEDNNHQIDIQERIKILTKHT